MALSLPPQTRSIHLPLFRLPSPQPPGPPFPCNPSWGKTTPKSLRVVPALTSAGGGQPGSPAERCLSPARGHQPWRPAAPPPRPAPGGICRQQGGRKLICFEEEIKKINSETSNVDPHPLPQREKLNELPTWARVANNSPGANRATQVAFAMGKRALTLWRGLLHPACSEGGCDTPMGGPEALRSPRWPAPGAQTAQGAGWALHSGCEEEEGALLRTLQHPAPSQPSIPGSGTPCQAADATVLIRERWMGVWHAWLIARWPGEPSAAPVRGPKAALPGGDEPGWGGSWGDG